MKLTLHRNSFLSFFDSYSGWALCAEGFMLGNPLLAQVGALIGFSGAILTWIMCEAMGRDIISVILGGAGTTVSPSAAIEGAEIEGEATICDIDATVDKLMEAKNIIIVPGYGLAVAQAQFAVAEIAKKLRDMGKNVRFGYVMLTFLCGPFSMWQNSLTLLVISLKEFIQLQVECLVN